MNRYYKPYCPKFKVGDKVVVDIKFEGEPSGLEKGKVYKIVSIINEVSHFHVKVNNKEGYRYNPTVFVSVHKYRREKINKICSKLETK